MVDAKVGKRRLHTHNGLLTTTRGGGMKTGFICDSGFNVSPAPRAGRRLIAVVLGGPTDQERTVRAPAPRARLQTYGWKRYSTQKLDTMPMAADAKGL
jgi:D-alanyl-D-alanine carboxypeptidase